MSAKPTSSDTKTDLNHEVPQTSSGDKPSDSNIHLKELQISSGHMDNAQNPSVNNPKLSGKLSEIVTENTSHESNDIQESNFSGMEFNLSTSIDAKKNEEQSSSPTKQGENNNSPGAPKPKNNFKASNPLSMKSILDRIQQDFPRTPSPVFGNTSTLMASLSADGLSGVSDLDFTILTDNSSSKDDQKPTDNSSKSPSDSKKTLWPQGEEKGDNTISEDRPLPAFSPSTFASSDLTMYGDQWAKSDDKTDSKSDQGDDMKSPVNSPPSSNTSANPSPNPDIKYSESSPQSDQKSPDQTLSAHANAQQYTPKSRKSPPPGYNTSAPSYFGSGFGDSNNLFKPSAVNLSANNQSPVKRIGQNERYTQQGYQPFGNNSAFAQFNSNPNYKGFNESAKFDRNFDHPAYPERAYGGYANSLGFNNNRSQGFNSSLNPNMVNLNSGVNTNGRAYMPPSARGGGGMYQKYPQNAYQNQNYDGAWNTHYDMNPAHYPNNPVNGGYHMPQPQHNFPGRKERSRDERRYNNRYGGSNSRFAANHYERENYRHDRSNFGGSYQSYHNYPPRGEPSRYHGNSHSHSRESSSQRDRHHRHDHMDMHRGTMSQNRSQLLEEFRATYATHSFAVGPSSSPEITTSNIDSSGEKKGEATVTEHATHKKMNQNQTNPKKITGESMASVIARAIRKNSGVEGPIHEKNEIAPEETTSSSGAKASGFSGNVRRWSLSGLGSHTVEFAKDQFGSRFIQQQLEVVTPEETDEAFQKLLPSALELMSDVFGNYVIQKYFEYGTNSHRHQLMKCIQGNVLDLSLQMYGCRVIQKALEVMPASEQGAVIGELEHHILKCVKDQNGNHVVQKCIEQVENSKLAFILHTLSTQVRSLAKHPYGCRVIQRILEHCNEEQTFPFLRDIRHNVHNLAQDQFGNYVVQHVLEHGKEGDRQVLVTQISDKVVQFSRHKFASNVVERCLQFGTTEQKLMIIEKVCTPQGSGVLPLELMMKDAYANYVIQKIIDVAERVSPKYFMQIVECIKNQSAQLRRFTYGKHILARLERKTKARLREERGMEPHHHVYY